MDKLSSATAGSDDEALRHIDEESVDIGVYIDYVRDLLHEGREKGFVTYEDIEKRMPKELLTVEFLDNLYTNLMDIGVDVI
ncbi:MAG: RNA polymerase sigma factor region1.1 domain-containing protein, partial [Synergistes sp.]|nr:RNA polymerase sigma factor region1.1 domain-containing protein [Synergistes sp.]